MAPNASTVAATSLLGVGMSAILDQDAPTGRAAVGGAAGVVATAPVARVGGGLTVAGGTTSVPVHALARRATAAMDVRIDLFVYAAPPMPIELLVAVGGAIASFLSGLLGVGGGIVLTPYLLYAPPLVGSAALPVKIVTGLTIVQAISGSVIGSFRHHRYGNVSLRLVRVMGPTGAAASLAGAFLSAYAPDRLLVGIFAVFALVAAVALLLPQRGPAQPVDDLHLNVPVAIAISVVIGFFGGMVGIAAIAFIIAALIYVLRVPTRVAIGSSLAIGMFAAFAALIGKAATAQVDPPLALIVLGAALVSSPIGAAVSQRTRPGLLLQLLAVVVFLSGIRMAWQAVTGV
ncbi:MAG: sulfite exporter TauE/SafE family protein [Chloroflexi bacterium]|nr:sulfite exporter TauE/SafE family protein [Chloroflexota bacterium]